eukprot:Skav225874  [mRNA]  locus=scaffold1705:1217:1510:+ [translate_table: standard]
METPDLSLSLIGNVDLFIFRHEEAPQPGTLLVGCLTHHHRFRLTRIEAQDAAVVLVQKVEHLVLGHKQVICIELQLAVEGHHRHHRLKSFFSHQFPH